MKSNDPWPELEFRFTQRDLDAMREADAPRGMSGEDYLKFLMQFPPPTYEQLRKKEGPSGERFRL